jgi:hypothetical protein
MRYHAFLSLLLAQCQECKSQGILDAKIWDTGLAVITKNLQIYAIPDIEAPFTIKLKNPGMHAVILGVILLTVRTHFSAEVVASDET